MKQERIEELLKGTPDEGLGMRDGALNAARVQLLAKALQKAREFFVDEGADIAFIDAALAEAGITQEKVG